MLLLDDDTVSQRLQPLCDQVEGGHVLAVIPDGTRTAPMPLLFRLLCEKLHHKVSKLTFLIALGTHPLMSDDEIETLLGISKAERERCYPRVEVVNHRWDLPETFECVGELSIEETEQLSEGRLSVAVPIRVNKLLLEADTSIIVGPVFPHEVAGFSGGSKYLFPGVGGADVINFTHWLGALMTSHATIGIRDTVVRRAIELAASRVPGRRLAICMVTSKEGLHGVFTGEVQTAWRQAAELSSEVHITWCERPYRTVLSVIPERYADLWTGAKGMYKVEPVLANGGEVILLAPHIREFSYTHGKVLEQIGYHIRDYFVAQWDKFHNLPWGVLAHSTHLRGDGTFVDGVERPRVKVTLASAISPQRCQAMNLGYLDPATVKLEDYEGRDDTLLVRNAGEILYRLR